MPDLTPPHNEDLEIELLGSIMLNPGSMDDVCTLLNDDAFYNPVHSIIYSAIRNLHKTVLSYDLSSVTDELIKQKKLEKIGGKAKLVLIQEQTPLGIDIKSHCQKVQDLYLERQLGELGNRFVQLSQKGDVPVRERLQEAEKGLFNLSLKSTQRKKQTLADGAVKALATIEERSKSGKLIGVASCFEKLNILTNGYKPNCVTYVLARPSMGKTSYALQEAENFASQGIYTYFFSLEMNNEELAVKSASRRSRLNSNKLEAGQIADDDEWDFLTSAFVEISNYDNLIIDDEPYRNIDEIHSILRSEKLDKDLGVAIIDHVQIIDYKGLRPYEAMSEISRKLKAIAKELNIHIIALSQLSRDIEKREDKRPLMSDARESGTIEQDADVVIGLYRDEYYNPDTLEPGIAEIIVRKNRGGPKGTVKVKFEPQYSNFQNLPSTYWNPRAN